MKPRFFVNLPFERDQTVELPSEESHHLSRVLRLTEGELIDLVDGKGHVATAEIVEITKRTSRARIVAIETVKEASRVQLVFALPKAPALEFILRRVTELGVAQFQPLETQHSLRHSSWNDERWKKIIAEVSKQCQETTFPTLLPPLPLSQWLTRRDPKRALLFCHEGLRKTENAASLEACDVLVGAEGGWSEEESKRIFAAGATALGLGKNRLRAETAALIAVALAKIKIGELT